MEEKVQRRRPAQGPNPRRGRCSHIEWDSPEQLAEVKARAAARGESLTKFVIGRALEDPVVGPGSAEMREKFAALMVAAKSGAASKESRESAIDALETMRLDMAPWYFDQTAELRTAFLRDLSEAIEEAKVAP